MDENVKSFSSSKKKTAWNLNFFNFLIRVPWPALDSLNQSEYHTVLNQRKSEQVNKSSYLMFDWAIYLKAIVGPTTKLHFASLVIKGEPRNVNLARALEDARWHVQAATVISNHNVSRIRPVETLISTSNQNKREKLESIFCIFFSNGK